MIALSRLRQILEVDLAERPRDRRAGRGQPGRVPRGRADALLPAGSFEPGRLYGRRQRRGELGRRALLQVRVHDELRHGPRGRPPRRRRRRARRDGARPSGARPRRSVRRLGGDARRCDSDHARVVPVPETVRTLVAYFETMAAAGQTVSDVVASGVVPGAIEIIDHSSRSRRPRRRRRPGTRSTSRPR